MTMKNADTDTDTETDTEFASVEDWLRTVLGQRIDHEFSAQAMIDDGHTPSYAHLMAAMSLVRHSPLSLHDLLGTEEGQRALRNLGRHVAGGLDELYTGPNLAQPLFDPTRHAGHRIALSDREVELQMVAHHPPTALLGGLLSDEECAALIALGSDSLDGSSIVDKQDGVSRRNAQIRSSYGTFFEFSETPQLEAVGRRVAQLVGRDHQLHEAVALTRYLPGEQFLPHHDFFPSTLAEHAEHTRNGGQRIATLVIYLNDVEAGGATQLPYRHLEIRPQRGAGLYFSYQRRDGSPDPASLHAGAPVLSGEKWIATVWFREREWLRGIDDDDDNAAAVPAPQD